MINTKTYKKLKNPDIKAKTRKNLVRWRNLYVRLRDLTKLPSGKIYGKCISCGRVWNVELFSDQSIMNGKQWHAGHYFREDRYESTAHNSNNIWLQCSKCNRYLSGNLSEYKINLIKKIGKEQFDKLEKEHNKIKKYSVLDYRDLATSYKYLAHREAERLKIKI